MITNRPSPAAIAVFLDRHVDWTDQAWWWYDQEARVINRYAQFFCDFICEDAAPSGWLALTADTSFTLWLNGIWLNHGPMREVAPFFYYDVIDLKPWLKPGNNSLRILVHCAGVNTQSQEPNEVGLMVKGQVEGKNSRWDFGSAASWRVMPAVEYRGDAHRLGSCIGFSEFIDFNRTDPDWLRRPTPSEANLPVCRSIFPHGRLTRPLARNYPGLSGEQKEGTLLSRPATGIQLWDMGREVFGFVQLRIEADEPLTLDVAYSENLNGDRVDDTKGGMDYRDRLILPRGKHLWTSFEKRGFRYVELRGEVRVISLSVQEYHYPYKEHYKRPADPLDARIIDLAARSIELCSDDLLNDCVWRERAQYMDPRTYIRSMQMLFDTLEPARKYLYQMLRPVESRGVFPACYPSPTKEFIIPDFAFTIPLLIELYQQLSGDNEIIGKAYDAARQAVLWYDPYVDSSGLATQPPGWTFLDNTFDLNKFPQSAGLNAIYHDALRALASMATQLDRNNDAQELEERRKLTRKSWRETFLHAEGIWDSSSSRDFASRHYWNYHYPADFTDWRPGHSFLLKTMVKFPSAGLHQFYFSHFAGLRVWLDGQLIASLESGGGWSNPPIFHPNAIPWQATGDWQHLWIEVQYSSTDWEVYVGSDVPVEMKNARVRPLPIFAGVDSDTLQSEDGIKCQWRPYSVPRLSQITVGYAAGSGVLEPDEARRCLEACLTPHYYSPWRRRTTPFFVNITEDAALLRDTIMPCNTPMSLYAFCSSLRKYGMKDEACDYIRRIYRQMLDLGATSCWEEWGDKSSLCHAWGAFVAEFLLD
jgi:hypothetical protein